MVELLRHRQTKGAVTDMFYLTSTEIGACDNEVRFTLELGHRAMLSSQHLFGCAK